MGQSLSGTGGNSRHSFAQLHHTRPSRDVAAETEARNRKLERANQRLEREIERRRGLEEMLRARLAETQDVVREKEFLIKEVNHRIKNSLQAALSLLSIQANRDGDRHVRDALQSASLRLARLAEIHELLYKAEGYQTIEVRDYLKGLCQRLLLSFQPASEHVTLDLDIETVEWGPDLVLPLALIVNEAVTNAIKYAFPQQRRGTIRVTLRRGARNDYRLVVQDDGIGLSDEVRHGCLGLKLIAMFAKQIGGNCQVATGGGTTVAVSFPA